MSNVAVEQAPVDDPELVLRRYNPNNADHRTINQQTGEVTIRSGCLVWDREPEDRDAQVDYYGISVFRDAILIGMGIERSRVLQPPNYTGLLGLTATQVRQSSTPSTTADVVADPLPVTGEHDIHNVAHALIRVGGNTSRNQRDRVASNIAKRMRPVNAA